VFGGNNVIDQSYEAATFQDLGSSPSNMAAGKYLDYYSCLPGHSGQQADACQAYIQSEYTGTETWLILPEEVWPAEWRGKFACPVVRMDKALYGHPDSGGMWERHCHKSLTELGFVKVPDWDSVYYHSGLKLLLSVYVDDFKMAGPTKNLQKGWDLIRSKIEIEDPMAFHLFLGCIHRRFTATIPAEFNSSASSPEGSIAEATGMEYDMQSYFIQSLELYERLTKQYYGQTVEYKSVQTPFATEDEMRNSLQRSPCRPDELDKAHTCPWCLHYLVPDQDTKGDVAHRLH